MLSSSSHPTEDITKIELYTACLPSPVSELRKYIFESTKSPFRVISGSSSIWISSHSTKWISFCRAKLVIFTLFLFIAKCLVGFIDLFEFCFGFFISFIPIRVIVHRLFLIGFFYLCFARSFRYSEYIVIVFTHRDIVSKK